MKFSIPALLSLAICGATLADPTPPTKGMGMQVMPKDVPVTANDSATAEQVKEMQAKSKAGELAPAGFERNTWSLEKTSQFIHYGEHTTLVPKGSLIYIPEKYKENIVPGPGTDMISWTEFAGKYRAILTFLEVDLDQASGVKPLDAAKMKAARDTGMIVVALYQRGPISVVQPAGSTPPLNKP